MQSFKIFTPSPILGYGYDLDEFWRIIEHEQPSAIIVDSGSTDPGPYMLGTGKTLCSKQSYFRDLIPMLESCSKYGTKILIGSAGGAGTNAQVDVLVEIIRQIAEAEKLHFKVATIKFNDDRELFKANLDGILPCGSAPDITEHDVVNATTIVAQMGAEPFQKVLQDESIDIIVAGRSYDPAPYAAFCMHHGVQESSAWHVGKIIECGGLCTKPKGRSILATMYRDSFELTPTNPIEKCTPTSVAAHTMYEKTRPDRLPGPGGVLHLDGTVYRQQPDGRSVLVSGSVFVPSPKYQIKLEGAEHVGFRTIFIGGIRDPILINGVDEFLKTIRKTTKAAFPQLDESGDLQLVFHLYGKNAVMGSMEPVSQSLSHELGILGEAFASSQEDADAVAAFARTVALHGAYYGQIATAGNLASPLTPLEQSAGPVFKFSIYHLMEIDDPTSLFPINTLYVGDASDRRQSDEAKLPSIPQTLPNGVNDSTNQLRKTRPELPPNDVVSATFENKPKARNAVKILNFAEVVRSKNSGPFEVTLDILFRDKQDFERARDSQVLTTTLIKKLYNLKDQDIVTLMFFEPALGWKCTFKRPWAQGSVGERDTFGAQQHAPLLEIILPALK